MSQTTTNYSDFETVSATTLGTFTGNLGAGLLQGGSDERQSKGKPSKSAMSGGFSVPNPSTRLKQLEEQLVESPYSMSSLIQDYAPDYASEQMNALDRSLMSIFSVTSTSSSGRDSSNPISSSSSNSNKRPSTSSNQSNFWKPETRSQTEKSAVHSDLQSRNQRHVEDQSWISKEWDTLMGYHQGLQLDRRSAEGHPLSTLMGEGKQGVNTTLDMGSFGLSTASTLLLPSFMSTPLNDWISKVSLAAHLTIAPTERYGADVMNLLSLGVGAVDGVGELNLLSRGAGMFGRSVGIGSAVSSGELAFLKNAKLLGESDLYNLGTLSDRTASSFISGRYKTYQLTDDFLMYRAGTNSRPLGQHLSFEKPIGELQTRIDKAILPVWPDGGVSPIDTGFAFRVPQGTVVHVGDIANQGGIFLGGTRQIIIEKSLLNNLKLLDSYPLQKENLWLNTRLTK